MYFADLATSRLPRAARTELTLETVGKKFFGALLFELWRRAQGSKRMVVDLVRSVVADDGFLCVDPLGTNAIMQSDAAGCS